MQHLFPTSLIPLSNTNRFLLRSLKCYFIYKQGWGESCVIGVAGAGEELSTRPFQLVTGRVWRGSAFGGYKSRSEVPGLVDEYMSGDLIIDKMVSATYPLAEINTAFRDMHSGQNIRGVIMYS